MASGVRRIHTPLAIAGVADNILQGTPLEYPGVKSKVEIYSTTDAQGAVGNEVTMDVQFGTEVVAENVVLPIETAAGQGPLIPDHTIVVDALLPSDRLVVRIRNADAAAAHDIISVVRVMPQA